MDNMDLTKFSIEELCDLYEETRKSISKMVFNPKAILLMGDIEKELKSRGYNGDSKKSSSRNS